MLGFKSEQYFCTLDFGIFNLLARKQAPGEPEQSEGACRHSIDAAVL